MTKTQIDKLNKSQKYWDLKNWTIKINDVIQKNILISYRKLTLFLYVINI